MTARSHIDIAAMLAEPQRAQQVPVEAIPVLLTQLAADQSCRSALQAALSARLVVGTAAQNGGQADEDELVDVRQAAKLLGMSQSWVYRNAKSLPFTRTVGPRALRFSVHGIRKFQANRSPV